MHRMADSEHTDKAQLFSVGKQLRFLSYKQQIHALIGNFLFRGV